MIGLYDIGEALLARLRSIDDPVQILELVADLTQAQTFLEHSPALIVCPLTTEPADTVEDGASVVVRQTWVILLTLRSVDDRTGQACLPQASRLAAGIMGAICGWRPSPVASPFRWIAPPRPPQFQAGIFFSLFAFETKFVYNFLPPGGLHE